MFISLFKGREDVYAKRWQNRDGRAGYAPVCRNEWKAGLYPLRRDYFRHLLAVDFDEQGWQWDCAALREVCENFGIPVALERSRSGNGAHAWFFFVDPLPACLARKFGAALLTCAMSRRHELSFKSYDRFSPIRTPCQRTASET